MFIFPFPLYRLDEKKGIATGSTYVNRKQARVLNQGVKHIAVADRKTLQSKIAAAKFLSIMSDGSTDTSVIETGNTVYTLLQPRQGRGPLCRDTGCGESSQ